MRSHQDMLALCVCRESARRVAGFRLMHLIPGVVSTSAQRVLDHIAGARTDRRTGRRAGSAARRS